MMKLCTKCGEEKELSEFYPDKRRKLRVAVYCKVCTREQLNQWSRENPERRLAREREASKKRYKNNPEKKRERSKQWRKNNPAKVREQQHRRALKLFQKCLDHYGHSCSLCGSTANLCMDHIGGNQGDSPNYWTPLWAWLIRNNFPPGFRTLCRDCNLKDGHQRKGEK